MTFGINERKFIIPAGGQVDITNRYDYLIVRRSSMNGFEIVFDTGSATGVQQGDKIKLPKEAVATTFKNTSQTSDLHITVVLCQGVILESSDLEVKGSVVTSSGASVQHDKQNVTTTAVVLAGADQNRTRLTIKPLSGDVYIGGEGVSVANGMPVEEGTAYTSESGGEIWACSATGTVDVRLLAEGV